MASERKLRLGEFFSGTGSNMASWRHPNAVADGAINLEYYKTLTKKAEDAKLDFVFFGDGLYISEKSHPIFLNRFEPLTLLATLAAHTTHIGFHPLHHLQRSLHRGQAVFVHRPHQQWTGRLEYRDLPS